MKTPRNTTTQTRVSAHSTRGEVRVGISGYDYLRWRGAFYPERLARRRWLRFAAERFSSIELNGTFYSLKSPATFVRWRDATPPGFVFAVKGGRFLTHNLKLKHCETPLANFFASGVLALGVKLGPCLWQLPENLGFDAERMDAFMRLLPRTSHAAARLAEQHGPRLRDAWTTPGPRSRIRHAFEVRHPSFSHSEFYALLREHQCGWVIADTAGRFPHALEVTADFVYVRLHGSTELYVSGYSAAELASWAKRARRWSREGRDVFVYFDNDAEAFAPRDAMALGARLRSVAVSCT